MTAWEALNKINEIDSYLKLNEWNPMVQETVRSILLQYKYLLTDKLVDTKLKG